jgi:molybdopterin molybdotransferase
MKEFFKVTALDRVFDHLPDLPPVSAESVDLADAAQRVLAEDISADDNLPGFPRATMDGYAVRAASTFGASESNPGLLSVKGAVAMGRPPEFGIGPGEACRIATGGMLPQGADSVVMIEHTEALDDTTLEVYRSVAPGEHVLEVGEDFRQQQRILAGGLRLRAQEIGLLAAFGRGTVRVYRRPAVAVISTGDEVVPIECRPEVGRIRDINSYTLSAMVLAAGGLPLPCGIVRDDPDALFEACRRALAAADMVLISGGSSVGTRDYTIDVLGRLPAARILVHGISIRPGKPTILARVADKSVWGLPGHVVSAMVVFKMVVQPFLDRIGGAVSSRPAVRRPLARLSRNVSSVQGRTDFIRVRRFDENGETWAEPVLGKSGLLNTMVKADGLIQVDADTEGLERGERVEIIPL